MTSSSYSFAIVGLGPRGHYALECLVGALIDAGRTSGISIIGFEPTPHRGIGPVYNRDQSGSNWINITDRVLDIPGRPPMQFGAVSIEGFPDYHQWAGLDFDTWPEERVDTFPPRATFGDYLNQRFESLYKPLRHANVFTLVNDTVDKVISDEGKWGVEDRSGRTYSIDNILLTVGHQPTEADPQLSGWKEQVKGTSGLHLFNDAYPVENINNAMQGESSGTVAIRGYGLATIDVVRALAEQFGSFGTPDAQTRAQTYTLAKDRSLEIAPFSLDGLCIGPKPITPQLDSHFAPTEAELRALEDYLADREAQVVAKDANFLINAMCPIVVRVFIDMPNKRDGAPTDPGEIEHLFRKWVKDNHLKHECIQDTSIPPSEMLAALTGMAVGELPVTLDYCIGQVWRQCQMSIYSALSHGTLPDNVLAEIIGVDEALKRYSYGPPVESLQQLIALHDAGILNLDLLNNPNIDLGDEGWTLHSDDASFTTKVMINAVVDAPNIKAVQSPLLSSLLHDGLMEPVHDGLGITTGKDAYVLTTDTETAVPVALLGRLAKGTVIGVDAILECFGERPHIWARSAADRV